MSDGRDDADDDCLPELPDAEGEEAAPRRPGRRTKSNEELELRYELVAEELSKRRKKGQLKKKMKEMWGISSRTCEEYISRAREIQIKWTQQPKEEHFNEAACYYLSIMRDPESPPAVRLKAQEDLVALYGIGSAAKFEHSGPGGVPLPSATTVPPVVRIQVVRQADGEAAVRVPAVGADAEDG